VVDFFLFSLRLVVSLILIIVAQMISILTELIIWLVLVANITHALIG